MFRGDLKPIRYIQIREDLGGIYHVRISERRHKHSTTVNELCCTKLNSDTVASQDYMIHDGDYYSIIDKDKILLLLDKIEQRIIWMCHQKCI